MPLRSTELLEPGLRGLGRAELVDLVLVVYAVPDELGYAAGKREGMSSDEWASLTGKREEVLMWLIDEAPFESYPELLAVEVGGKRAADEVALTFGCVLEDTEVDWKERWRRPVEDVESFDLLARGVVLFESTEVMCPPATVDSYDIVESDGVAGLAIQMSAGTALTVVARRYQAAFNATFSRQKTFKAKPDEITFRGSGEFTARDMRASLHKHGVSAQVFANWRGSGQRFGAAFLANVNEPTLVDDDDIFGGAWLLLPGEATGPDPTCGVWVVGQSLPGGYYATAQRAPEAPRSFWTAVANSLASLSGGDCATSGNVLFDDVQQVEAWLRNGKLPAITGD